MAPHRVNRTKPALYSLVEDGSECIDIVVVAFVPKLRYGFGIPVAQADGGILTHQKASADRHPLYSPVQGRAGRQPNPRQMKNKIAVVDVSRYPGICK